MCLVEGLLQILLNLKVLSFLRYLFVLQVRLRENTNWVLVRTMLMFPLDINFPSFILIQFILFYFILIYFFSYDIYHSLFWDIVIDLAFLPEGSPSFLVENCDIDFYNPFCLPEPFPNKVVGMVVSRRKIHVAIG